MDHVAIREPAPALLTVRDAHKSFSGRVALRGVGLSAHAGEWIGLIGENGAGKTTLMRAITGLVALDRGEVRARGGRAGFVPQQIALYPALTARENLEVFGRLLGVRGDRLRERVRWGLAWTGLDRRGDDQVKTFSGGMQRRLNIACSVLHQPRVVLLDEPTVGIDTRGRQRIWAMLDELRRDGAVLIQSSHQLNEIESMCDRLLILDDGRIVAEGTLDQLASSTAIVSRTVRVQLDGSLEHAELDGRYLVEGCFVTAVMGDLTSELPELLKRLRVAGLHVLDVKVERPTLEQVFVRLTGREGRG